MIDDKRIEEEAVKSTNYLKGLCDFTVINASKEGFMAGAKWAVNEFLKDLLHDAEEEPKKGRVFLYKTIFGGYGINQIINGDEWKYIIKYQRATQWLYIDDLLPKKGDKHD